MGIFSHMIMKRQIHFLLILALLGLSFSTQAQKLNLPQPAITYLGKSQKSQELKELKKALKAQGIKIEAVAKNKWRSADGDFCMWFVKIDKTYTLVKMGARPNYDFQLTQDLFLDGDAREKPEVHFSDYIFVNEIHPPRRRVTTIGFRNAKKHAVKLNEDVVYAVDEKGYHYVHAARHLSGNDEPELLDHFPKHGTFKKYVADLGYTPKTFFPRIKIVPGQMDCAKYDCQNGMGRVNLGEKFYFYGQFKDGMAQGKGTFHHEAEDGTYSTFTSLMSHGLPNDWFIMNIYKSRAAKKAKEKPLAEYKGQCEWGEFVGTMEFSDKRLLMEGSFVFAPRENRRQKPVRHFPGYFRVKSGLSEFDYHGPGYMFPICFSSIEERTFELDHQPYTISPVARLHYPKKTNSVTGKKYEYPCIMSQGELVGTQFAEGEKPFVTAACYYNRYFDQPEHGKPAAFDVSANALSQFFVAGLRSGTLPPDLFSSELKSQGASLNISKLRRLFKDRLGVEANSLRLIHTTVLQRSEEAVQYGLLIEGTTYTGTNAGALDLLFIEEKDGLRIAGARGKDLANPNNTYQAERAHPAWEKALRQLIEAANSNFEGIKGEPIVEDDQSGNTYGCYFAPVLTNRKYYKSTLSIPDAKDCRLVASTDGQASDQEAKAARSWVAQFLSPRTKRPEQGLQQLIMLYTTVDYILQQKLKAKLLEDAPYFNSGFLERHSQKQYQVPGLPKGYVLSLGFESRVDYFGEHNLYLRIGKEEE